jgi:ribosomal protein S18 acetylase RimI-like enzyme
LKGSYISWLAIDSSTGVVVGFINAISDGVMAAYIPLLEVLPEYQNKGIGKELVSRMIKSLKHLYMVDVLCDEEIQTYYAKFGMINSTGSILRNYDRQNCE